MIPDNHVGSLLAFDIKLLTFYLQASGTLAFVAFACLMLAANMGYLPLNTASLNEDNVNKLNPFVLENKVSYTARSFQSQVCIPSAVRSEVLSDRH